MVVREWTQDKLEEALNPVGASPPPPPLQNKNDADDAVRTRSGARIRGISEAGAITFSSGLVQRSALARAFCSSDVFQRLAHDVLNVPDVRLYHDQAVYKKPCPGRTFPFHQVRSSMLFGVPSS